MREVERKCKTKRRGEEDSEVERKGEDEKVERKGDEDEAVERKDDEDSPGCVDARRMLLGTPNVWQVFNFLTMLRDFLREHGRRYYFELDVGQHGNKPWIKYYGESLCFRVTKKRIPEIPAIPEFGLDVISFG